MRKVLERCNKAIRRIGDEGFSLVELIIVIAIMVALVAILAPQYFQYIEKSRKAIDVSAASDILQATKVAAIDPDNKVSTGFTVTWTITGNTVTVGGAIADPAKASLQAALNATLADLSASKSAFATTAGNLVITATYAATTGFTFTVSGDAAGAAAGSGWATALGVTATGA